MNCFQFNSCTYSSEPKRNFYIYWNYHTFLLISLYTSNCQHLLIEGDIIIIQYINVFSLQNGTDLYEEETLSPDVHNNSRRRKRTAELALITSPPTFTATVPERTLRTDTTSSPVDRSGLISPADITSTDVQPTADPMVAEKPSTNVPSASHSNSTNVQASDSSVPGTTAFFLTSALPATLPPWLTKQSQAGDMTSDSSPMAVTPNPLRLSTRDASNTGHFSTRSAATSGITGAAGTTGGRAWTLHTASFKSLQPLI